MLDLQHISRAFCLIVIGNLMNVDVDTEQPEAEVQELERSGACEQSFYRVQFRKGGQFVTAAGEKDSYLANAVVMVGTDHGLEPAIVAGRAPLSGCRVEGRKASCRIERAATEIEVEKFRRLAESEKKAFDSCNRFIKKLQLVMNLVRVERFFNGSKMIFYFTADNRVDFRALVKDLVQEFRTRVEMRQVGVRHETKMIGGIGTCGRELCCSSFINRFDSVSIKMAKEQELPLNPNKISGVCNRLLCCLTYEYGMYKRQRKRMPKPGKKILIDGRKYLVRQQVVLKDAVIAENSNGETVTLEGSQWKGFRVLRRERADKDRRAGSPKDKVKERTRDGSRDRIEESDSKKNSQKR